MRRLPVLILTGVIAAFMTAFFAPTASALDIKDTPPPNGQIGVPYSFQFDMVPGSGSNGMTWKISSGSLPPGLSLNYEGARWARVVGTPTAAGTYKFYLQAIDIPGPWVCCTEEPYSITITSKLTVTSGSLPDAKINEAYTAGPLSAAGGTVSSWSLVNGLGAPPPGITFGTDGRFTGTPTQSGTFTFTVQANGSPNNDTKQLSIFVLAPLVLGGGGNPNPKETVALGGKLQTPFSWGVAAAGGKAPYTYTSTPLPTGITLNADGTVTGTPTVAGVTPVTFTVTDATGATDTLKTSINVKALLAFSTTVKPRVGRVGVIYSWKLPVTGASTTKIYVASGKYPPGLELDETTGIVSGTPLVKGSYKVKFWVLGDPGTQIFKTYTIKITP